MSLRLRLARREPLFGLIVKMPSESTVEIAGHVGFDLVLLDTEHASGDTRELEHHVRAADAAGIPLLVRVASAEPAAVLRALDAGAAGIVVPHISTEAAAEAVVRTAHYPPRGVRSLAVSTRSGHHGLTVLTDHLARAARDTVVVVQAEDRHAARNSAAIAATPGVDAVWIGPTDLSLSLGIPGQLQHAEYRAAVGQIVTAVTAAPDCALCVIVDRPEQTAQWHDRGANVFFFNHSTLLINSLKGVLQLRAPLGKPSTGR